MVGKVGRAHGVRGAVRVFPLDEESTSLEHVGCVYLSREEGDARSYKLEHVKRCGRYYAVKLEGCDERDGASALTGLACYIERSALPPLKGMFYAVDMVGAVLIDENDKVWGRVLDVECAPASDIIIYRRPSGGQGMVPLVSHYVGEIDVESGRIQVRAESMAQIDEVYGGEFA